MLKDKKGMKCNQGKRGKWENGKQESATTNYIN
jgi:hypothetical protein